MYGKPGGFALRFFMILLAIPCVLTLCSCGAPDALTGAAAAQASVSPTLHIISETFEPLPASTPAYSPPPTSLYDPKPFSIEETSALAEPGTFTFAWFSDTQYYAAWSPEVLDKMVQWVLSNKDAKNIIYMLHTGDLVDTMYNEDQWIRADKAFVPLDGVLPYGVLAGNHDATRSDSSFDTYRSYFGADRFENNGFYGGTYLNNRGHYDLISAGGIDFIMLYMSWNIKSGGIEWMNEVLAEYPDRIAFILTHDYMYAPGVLSEEGQDLYNRVVSKNSNVHYVLCGHSDGIGRREDEIDDDGDGTPDRTVYQVLANYQSVGDAGEGYFRLLTFDPDAGEIQITTYSPHLRDYNYHDESEETFTLPLP